MDLLLLYCSSSCEIVIFSHLPLYIVLLFD